MPAKAVGETGNQGDQCQEADLKFVGLVEFHKRFDFVFDHEFFRTNWFYHVTAGVSGECRFYFQPTARPTKKPRHCGVWRGEVFLLPAYTPLTFLMKSMIGSNAAEISTT